MTVLRFFLRRLVRLILLTIQRCLLNKPSSRSVQRFYMGLSNSFIHSSNIPFPKEPDTSAVDSTSVFTSLIGFHIFILKTLATVDVGALNTRQQRCQHNDKQFHIKNSNANFRNVMYF